MYVSPHPLSEAISAWFFLCGAALFLTSRRDFASGLLLGLAFVARIQLAPAIAALVFVGDWRRSPKLVLGGVLAMAIDSAVNVSAGRPPLLWIYHDVAENLLHAKAAEFGIASPLAYLITFAVSWNVLLFVIVPLAMWGGLRYPALLVAALVHLFAHWLIGHKEWRFVFVTQLLLVMLTGFGAARLIRTSFEASIAAIGGLVSVAVAMTNPIFVSNYWNLRALNKE